MAGEILDNQGRGEASWNWPAIHPEGRKYGIIAIGLSLIPLLLLDWEIIGWPMLLLSAGVFAFFRDPERVVPQADNAIVAPADGLISLISEVEPPPELLVEDGSGFEALPPGPVTRVSIFMDGNGRWAKKRGLPRSIGHQRGVEAVRRLVRGLEPMNLDCLTLYAFSSENWKRSEDEVDDLMNLMRKFIKSDLDEFIANSVRLKIIGDWRSLAPDIVEMLEDALEKTSQGKQVLAVALNYGSQNEIARAAAKAAAIGEVTPEAISAHLDTADMPPLDLLIRTSGEVRLSNFLLWQSAYAEMLFVDTLWPDFKPEHLGQALADFATRERRFGGRK